MINPNGVIIKTVDAPVHIIADRLLDLLKLRSIKVYAVIDQRNELKSAGIIIPPMQLIVFGNPLVGGPIMRDVPAAGLDLPLKILIWESETKNTYIAYNSLRYLQNRYYLTVENSNMLDIDGFVSSFLKEFK